METSKITTEVQATLTDAEFLKLVGAPENAQIVKFRHNTAGSISFKYRIVKE